MIIIITNKLECDYIRPHPRREGWSGTKSSGGIGGPPKQLNIAYVNTLIY